MSYIAVEYDSYRTDRTKTRYSDSTDYEFKYIIDEPFLEFVRSNGKQIRVDFTEMEAFQKSGTTWTRVGPVEDIFGEKRGQCGHCDEMRDGNIKLGDDNVMWECPECTWTEVLFP